MSEPRRWTLRRLFCRHNSRETVYDLSEAMGVRTTRMQSQQCLRCGADLMRTSPTEATS